MSEETNETTQAAASADTQATATPPAGGGEGKRPTFLTVLCILTFIGSGLGTLFMLLATVGMGALLESIPGLGAVAAGGTAYFGISTVLAAGSLFGAVQMWKLKKTGFYIYTGSNALMVLLPLFFGIGFSAAGAVIPVLFIVLYGLNLKHMS